MSNKEIYIIDGFGQIFRHYYAHVNNPLTDKSGKNVSAVFGFFITFFSIIKKYSPKYICVAFDSSGKTFRHNLYPDYKANREKAPEDLKSQIPLIREILDLMKVRVYEQSGMEADDLIASVTECSLKADINPVIVTSDKDLMQLVSSSVKVLRPSVSESKEPYRLYGPEEVKEEYGVTPGQMADYLTILGDSSDNVPGIKGLGKVSAVKLLSDFGTLDAVYDNMDSLTDSVRKKLNDSKDQIPLSRELILLKKDLLNLKPSDYDSMQVDRIDFLSAKEKFIQIGSARLLKITDELALTSVPEAKPVKTVTEIPRRENEISGFDIKEKLKETGNYNVPIFDCGVAQWLLDSNCAEYDEKSVFSRNSVEKNNIQVLRDKLASQLLQHDLYELFENLEMPLLKVLSHMEKNGVLIDIESLSSYEDELKEKCRSLEQSIWILCGKEFNLNSSTQLQEILFVDRNLPKGRKTKTGFSTDLQVLEELSSKTDDPLPGLLLEYRLCNKLLNTYVSTLPSYINPVTGRIHPTFVQTGTATGRLSCKNPNLQNVPVRTEEGRRIRNAFVASPGCYLLSADYSQIELRVLAEMSGDTVLRNAFLNGEDVHRETASILFNVIPELVTSQMRGVAKTINFGVIYGLSPFGLSQNLKISPRKSADFIITYFEKYAKVKEFTERIKLEASENGYVKTSMGHIRYINVISDSNVNLRHAMERSAVNTVIQGTASEIMKLAMLSVYSELKKNKLKSEMLLQVHDELILEVPKEELTEVSDLVKSRMENAFKMTVPLVVNVEYADRWGLMHL